MPKKPQNEPIEFRYEKSTNYQTHQPSGIFGGFDKTGRFFMSFYVEHLPFPSNTKIEFDLESGAVKKEISEVNQAKLVREVQSGIILDYPVLKNVQAWLNKKIAEFENLNQDKLSSIQNKENNGE